MTSRWKKSLTVLAAAVVLVFLLICTAAVVLLYSYDFNRLKPLITRRVQAATGWDLTIAGDIQVRPGLPPLLSAEAVSIQNAAWAEQVKMAAVERVEVGVRLGPLLQRRLVISHVRLIGPQLRLQGIPDGERKTKAADSRTDVAEKTRTPPVDIEKFQIRNGRVRYQEAGGPEHVLMLAEFNLRQTGNTGAGHTIDFEGAIDSEPLAIEGTLTQLAGFVFARETLAFDLSADVRSAQLSATGRLRPDERDVHLDSQVAAEGNTLSGVLRVVGIDDFPDFGPFRFQGAVAGALTSLAAREIQFQAGGNGHPQTRIAGRIGNLNDLKDVELDFECRDPQVDSLARVLDVDLPLEGPFRLTGQFDSPEKDRYRFGEMLLVLGENRFQGSLQLDTAGERMQMKLALAGPRLDLRVLDVRLPAPADTYADLGPVRFELDAAAPFESLTIPVFRLQVGTPQRLQLNLEGSAENLPALQGVTLNWRIGGQRLQEFGRLLGTALPGSGAFQGSGKVRTSAAKRFHLVDLNVAAFGSDLQGSALLDLSIEPVAAEAVLNSRMLDLRPFFEMKSPADPAAAGEEAILPEALQEVSARIEYRAETVRTPEFTLPAVSAEAALQKSELRLLIRGPQLPDVHPAVTLSRLGAFRLELVVPEPGAPSAAVNFELKSGSPQSALLELRGSLPAVTTLYPLEMQFGLQTENITALESILGESVPWTGPLAADGRLQIASADTYNWTQIDVRTANSALTGEFLLNLAGDRPIVAAILQSPRLDLSSLLPADPENATEAETEEPQELTTVLRQMLQPWIRFLQALDIDAEVALAQIRYDEFKIQDLIVTIRLEDGGLQLQGVSESAPEADGNTGTEKLPELGPVYLDLRVQAAGDDLAVEFLDISAGSIEMVHVVVEGRSRSLAELEGSDLHVRIEGREFARLKSFFGDFPDFDGPYWIAGNLQNPEPRIFRVSDFSLVAGASRMQGHLVFDYRGARPQVAAELQSERLDLVPLVAWLRPELPPEPPEPTRARNRRVIPDTPLNLDALKSWDGRLILNADRVRLPTLKMNEFVATVLVEDGNVLLDPIQFRSGRGRFEGEAVLRQTSANAVTSLNLRIEDLQLAETLAEMEIEPIFTGALNAEMNLTGRGRNVADLLGSLNGELSIVASNGRYNNRFVIPFLLDPNVRTTFLRALNPFYKQEEFTEFNCLVNQVKFQEGVAQWAAFLDTDRVYLAAGGKINLRTEDIDITINPQPKEGIGLEQIGEVTINLGELSKPFKLTGTLADPSVGVAPGRAAVTIGKALGGFALLGPVGLLAVFADFSLGKDNPCLQALESVGAAAPESKSDQNILQRMGQGVKNLFGGGEE